MFTPHHNKSSTPQTHNEANDIHAAAEAAVNVIQEREREGGNG